MKLVTQIYLDISEEKSVRARNIICDDDAIVWLGHAYKKQDYRSFL